MSVDWHFVLCLYVANCVAQALPLPTGRSELYLFLYRLLHLLLLNIRNVISTASASKIISMLDVSEQPLLQAGNESNSKVTTHSSVVVSEETKQ
jgi:hypothetical protein